MRISKIIAIATSAIMMAGMFLIIPKSENIISANTEYDNFKLNLLTEKNIVKASEDYYLNSSFENGTTESWVARGSATVSIDSRVGYRSNASVSVSGRTDSWNGVEYKLPTTFVAGTEYSFSAMVMYKTGSEEEAIKMTLQYDLDGEANYAEVALVTAKANTWTKIENTNFLLPAGATNMSVYLETPESTIDFYADNIIGAMAGTESPYKNESIFSIVGDLDLDGKVSVVDLILFQRYLLGIETLTSEQAERADMVLDGNLDSLDIVALKWKLMKKEPIIEEPVSDFKYEANLQHASAPSGYLSAASQQGTLEKLTYKTSVYSSPLTKYANVYLPYGYNANDKTKKYNIFYLMHGGGENENTVLIVEKMMKPILDHMIMNGDMEPMIIVTPTFNNGSGSDTNSNAKNFHKELVKDLLPAVEGKYNTYANSTSSDDLKASRKHRAFGGFSMGSVATWEVFLNQLDYFQYFMPLSGDCWTGGSAAEKASNVANAAKQSGYSNREYFVFCATGNEDIAYPNIAPQVEAMKKYTNEFVYTSDLSKGNFYFLTYSQGTHWWGYVVHYIYRILPYFFHE